MTLIRGIAASIVIVGITALSTPCFACSCIARADEEQFTAADVVFTGHARSVRYSEHDPDAQAGPDTAHWTFQVQSVQKGRTGEVAEVSTSGSGGTCGSRFEIGHRYQVYATLDDGDNLRTSLCSGNRELGPQDTPYAPPTPVPTAPPTTAAPTASPALPATPIPTPSSSPVIVSARSSPDVVSTTESSIVPGLIALVMAVAALGLAVLLALKRSGDT